MSGQRRTPLRAKETAAAKQRFIDALASSGVVLAAVRAANVSRSVVYEWRAQDEDFRAAWLGALDDAADVLEAEAVRRATRGTSRPVFYKGEVVGSVQEHSDTLLMFLLKARRPERFRDNVNVTGRVESSTTVRVDPADPEVAAKARELAMLLAQRGRGVDE